MQVFKHSSELRPHLEELRAAGKSLGFVPTMGSLHRGHLSLVRHALRENDVVVVSIFVNPTQFNNAEDLQKYPCTPEADLELLEAAGIQLAYLPEVKDIYPDSVSSDDFDLGGFDEGMEGEHRPGHFSGMATVVARLFKIVKPSRAYFGEKDYQQLMIIRHLVKKLALDVEVVSHPIERGPGGLALSSRNQLLSKERQQQALAIYQALSWAKNNYDQLSPAAIQTHVRDLLEQSPVSPEYVAVVNSENLQLINEWDEASHARVFVAGHIGGVRLIDNIQLF